MSKRRPIVDEPVSLNGTEASTWEPERRVIACKRHLKRLRVQRRQLAKRIAKVQALLDSATGPKRRRRMWSRWALTRRLAELHTAEEENAADTARYQDLYSFAYDLYVVAVGRLKTQRRGKTEDDDDVASYGKIRRRE